MLLFNRQIALTSRYLNPFDENVPHKSLNGRYLGQSSHALEAGIVAGFYRDPVIVTVRLTYPVSTTGQNHPLQDHSAEKVQQGTQIFPDDYEAFLKRQPYARVGSDINGLKVTLMFVAALKM